MAQDQCWSGGVAVFVDEAAEYVDSFDTADVVDAGGVGFAGGTGMSRSMPRCGRAVL